MFNHNHACGGNRSRYTAMCPRQNGCCFPIKQNLTRALFNRSCGCGSARSGCGCGNTRTGCANCGNTRTGCTCQGSTFNARTGCGCQSTYSNARSGCGCQSTYSNARSGCGCQGSNSNTRSGCGCQDSNSNTRSGCGCNAYDDDDYQTRMTSTYASCPYRGTYTDGESYLNPVCPCQRARMAEGIGARMEMGDASGVCNVREFPSAIPGCDVSITPSTYRMPTPSQMPENPVYAMTYTKMQDFNAMYDPNVAITRGTAFPCLDKPFCGDTVGERGGCGCRGGRG